MATLNTYTYNHPLTQMAVSYYNNTTMDSDPALFIAPVVRAPGIRGDYKKFSRSDAFSVVDTYRAMYEGVKTVDITGEDVPYTLQPHGLKIGIENREVEGAVASYIDVLRQQKICSLLDKMRRSYQLKTFEVINREIPLTTTLGEMTDIGKWGNNSVDARKQLKELTRRFALLNGVYPNRILCGEEAWDILASNESIKDAVRYNSVNELEPDHLRKLLGYTKAGRQLDIMSSIQPYNTAPAGSADDTPNLDMLGNSLYMFWASDEPTVFDISAVKTLALPDGDLISSVETKYDDEHYTEWSRVNMCKQTVVTAPTCMIRIAVS